MSAGFWVRWIAIAATAVCALVGLDRFLLWAESRGWIYYRRRKPSRSALGDAFLAVQSIIESDKRHVLEVRRQAPHDEDGEAEPPPGARDAGEFGPARGVRAGLRRRAATKVRGAPSHKPHPLQRRPRGPR